MKIYTRCIATLIVVMFSQNSFAGNIHGEKDPLAVTYIKNNKSKPNAAFQEELRSKTAWQNFLNQHNNWYVQFNESTQRPHRAFGKPFGVNGSTPADAAMNFIETQLSGWNIPVNDLRFQSENFSGKYHNVFYTQTYQGLEVLNSSVFVKLTKGLKIHTWGTDIFDINISVIPSLSKDDAIAKAKAGISNRVTDVTVPGLKILPIPDGRSVILHLVFEMTVSTRSESNIPAQYYTLVDANSGEILYRQDKVRYAMPLNSQVNVVATVYEFQPYIPEVVLPLRNLKVVSGGINHTDSLGNLSLTGTNPINASFFLEGYWSKVVTDQGNTAAQLLLALPAGNDTVNMDTVASIHHTSGYFHVNNIHDFMKTFFPTFTGLDISLPTRIDVVGGSCNAFYAGTDINFFEEGGGCHCMSQIGDIVYHEYGHGINDKVYQSLNGNFQNGAMDEGYADVWGISLTQNPVLGRGESLSNPNTFIRRYDVNRKVYPQDIHGEPHDDGEIIAGAWYDVSVNLNSWSQMTTLFASTFNDKVTGPDGDEGQIFSDILLSALEYDDNDSDLTNGTPNDQAILDAFALHGIFLMNNASFVHNQMFSAPSSQPIEVTAVLNSMIPFLPTYLQLHYRTDDNNPFTNIPMTLDSGTTYFAEIPPQPAGTIISYYIKLIDSTSFSFTTDPAEADTFLPNIPYFIIVDCVREIIEDFDANQSPGWITSVPGDNATKGLWIIDTPLASFKSGDTCQTGVQHTPGGSKCAVTGNAPSLSSPNYNNDVNAGKTTLQSPAFDLTGYTDPIISYWRWYTNDQGSTGHRADFWRTYVSGDGINFTPVENISVPDHSWRRFAFKVNNYLPGATSVTIRFVADDTLVTSVIEAAVDDIEIYNNEILGIDNPKLENSLSLYPNPASTFLTLDVNIPKSGKINYEIVNGIGQIIISSSIELKAGFNSNKIDIQNLVNGVYYIVLKDEDSRLNKKFSVVR